MNNFMICFAVMKILPKIIQPTCVTVHNSSLIGSIFCNNIIDDMQFGFRANDYFYQYCLKNFKKNKGKEKKLAQRSI